MMFHSARHAIEITGWVLPLNPANARKFTCPRIQGWVVPIVEIVLGLNSNACIETRMTEKALSFTRDLVQNQTVLQTTRPASVQQFIASGSKVMTVEYRRAVTDQMVKQGTDQTET